MFRSLFLLVGLCLLSTLFTVPLGAEAHEVYVLSSNTITQATAAQSFSFIEIFQNNTYQTILWGSIVCFLIVTVFFISISVKLETKIDPYLVKMKRYAPFIARVVAGMGFVACGYFGAMFGPELPFSQMFQGQALWVQIIFIIIGLGFIFGIATRVFATIALFFFAVGVAKYGSYMFTYSNYFGELLVLLLVGSHKLSLDTSYKHSVFKNVKLFWNGMSRLFGEYAFLILRVSFGFSLIYASIYAKFLHNQLALEVVNQFHLVQYFQFAPEFIVFGAAIIEILLGLFFILGIEVRFTAIAINIFLFLSLMYFGETVWPHIILIGIPIAFLFYGYDRYSLEGFFFKKGNREPIF
jgi:uncharacterized membrane protein YphA (DoxX/SURF4 family)